MRPTNDTSYAFRVAAVDPPDQAGFRVAPALILIAGIAFNAGLAFVNGHVTPLSPALVIAAEAVLVSAALGLALLGWKPQMAPSLALIAFLAMFAIVRGLVMGQPEP